MFKDWVSQANLTRKIVGTFQSESKKTQKEQLKTQSDSEDEENGELSYYWYQINCSGDDPYIQINLDDPSLAEPCFDGEIGTYCFNLSVTDDLGSIGDDQVIVTILEELNEAPVADAVFGY